MNNTNELDLDGFEAEEQAPKKGFGQKLSSIFGKAAKNVKEFSKNRASEVKDLGRNWLGTAKLAKNYRSMSDEQKTEFKQKLKDSMPNTIPSVGVGVGTKLAVGSVAIGSGAAGLAAGAAVAAGAATMTVSAAKTAREIWVAREENEKFREAAKRIGVRSTFTNNVKKTWAGAGLGGIFGFGLAAGIGEALDSVSDVSEAANVDMPTETVEVANDAPAPVENVEPVDVDVPAENVEPEAGEVEEPVVEDASAEAPTMGAAEAQALKDEALELYRTGGTQEDVVRAIEMYEQAAEAGNAQAASDLAYLKANGVYETAMNNPVSPSSMEGFEAPASEVAEYDYQPDTEAEDMPASSVSPHGEYYQDLKEDDLYNAQAVEGTETVAPEDDFATEYAPEGADAYAPEAGYEAAVTTDKTDVITTCRSVGESEINGELRSNFMCTDPLAENLERGDAIDFVNDNGDIDRYIYTDEEPVNTWSFFARVKNTFGL